MSRTSTADRELSWSPVNAVFNIAAGALYALAYGSVFMAFRPGGALTAPQILFPVLLAGLTYFLVNSLATDVARALSGEAGFIELWIQSLPLIPVYYLASACGAAIVYLFYQLVGPGAFVLALPILGRRLLRPSLLQREVRRAVKVHKQTLEAFAFCIDAMELHTDFKHHTHTHIQRTQVLTLGLARALNVDERTYEGLRYASVLHDVGKISIPSYILHKPTRLTEREFQKMSTHPAVGAQILVVDRVPVSRGRDRQAPPRELGRDRATPTGSRGERFPLGSRILAVADCYEALTARRVYRRSLSRDAALDDHEARSAPVRPEDLSTRFLEIDPGARRGAQVHRGALARQTPRSIATAAGTPDVVGSPKRRR